MFRILGVIPARYASSRFPGKPLALIEGKSMIRRVYEQATKCPSLVKVIVATDDQRIFDHVKEFGGHVVMTGTHHKNGTSRCHEVLLKNKKSDAIINIQGDEPYIDPEQIQQVADLLQKKKVEIATLIKKINQSEDLINPNVVKVVTDHENRALYFSRQPIPYQREAEESDWIKKLSYYKHIGIYGYRADILSKIVKLAPSKLEESERLEQLRWLENGFSIYVQKTTFEAQAVDTPDDLLKLTNKS